MRERIGSYVARHHVGLLALMLVIAGGTAFAASLPKNSVRSKQIENGQVKSKDVGDGKLKGRDLKEGSIGSAEIGDGEISGQDVADGGIGGPDLAGDSVGSAQIAEGSVAGTDIAGGAVSGPKIANGSVGGIDLDPETVGNVISSGLSFPNDGVTHDLLLVEGFGRLTGSCSPPDSMNVAYQLDSPVTQVANLHVFDPVDLAPMQATVNSTATTGSVNAGGAGYLVQDGRFYSYTDDRVLAGEFRGSQFVGAGTCTFRARATVDHNDAP